MIKNSNYAVQRMEMLAIYFALLDNHKYLTLTRFVKRTASKNLNVHIRSDSKSTIEQSIGKSEIKDALIKTKEPLDRGDSPQIPRINSGRRQEEFD